MADLNHTAPGVYTQVIDQSFLPTQTSRFSCGLVGVAEKGPFDTPISIRTIKDYQKYFGGSIDGSYLPQAAAMVSSLSDGAIVVRVGRTFVPVSVEEAVGGIGSTLTPAITGANANKYVLKTPVANLFTLNSYVRVRQAGLPTTIAQVTGFQPTTGSPTAIVITSVDGTAGNALPAYTQASIDQCPVPNAANSAETFAYAYRYGASLTPTVSGTRNAYSFTLSATPGNNLQPNDLVRITQVGLATTSEARVASISQPAGDGSVVVNLVATLTAEQGYQPTPLQDSYAGAAIQVVSKDGGGNYLMFPFIQLFANSPGTWANSDGVTTGLIVRIGPGSSAGTKCFTVYQDSAQIEIIDNLTFQDPNDPNYAETRINAKSVSIQVTVLAPFYSNTSVQPPRTVDGPIGDVSTLGTTPVVGQFNLDNATPANTLAGWGTPTPVNLVAFNKGYNGENVLADSFVGADDPEGDGGTGLRVFNDTENITVDFLCCPGRTDIATIQEGAAVAANIRAQLLFDIPDNLNLREATDWHNGVGAYYGAGKLNTYSASCFWNWFSIIDPFDGVEKFIPPSIGALRCLAFTFDRFRPWFAAAGQIRGIIQEATGVRYTKVSQADRDASYGNGNSVNPIRLVRGQIMLDGERTTQRAESKLTAMHAVTLTNYMMRNLSVLGRQFIFDPNDTVLLSQLQAVYDQFLKGVQNERGLEGYALNVSADADQRNNREVEVDLAFIPTDAVERILINATVNSSGATLNAVSTSSGGTIGNTNS